MTGNTRRKTLILLGLVILITMILAANLSQLKLQPGMPLPQLQNGQLVTDPAKESQYVSISAQKFILIFLGLVLTVATLYMVYQLIRGADWKLIKEFMRAMAIISVIIGCLVFLVMLFPNSGKYIPVEVIPTPTPQPVVTAPLGIVPTSLLWLVGVGLFALSVFVTMWTLRPSRQTNLIDLVGLEAEKAREALKTGAGLKDVIIHCYIQMSEALKQEKEIERESFMTTGEFETVLKAKGFPHEPIHQLTGLFDAVRYGHWQPNPIDEQKAIQCLEAIMVHSRTTKGTK